MKPKKVLFVRTPPYDLNFGRYNVQQIGMGKAFCHLGIDFDFVTFKKKNCKTWVAYEENGHKCTVIEVPRLKLFRWGINKKLLDKTFLRQYDLVISQEYYQITTYLLSKRFPKTVMYTGPYWNLFHLKFSSLLYDLLFTKRINRQIKYKFAKSSLAKEFLEKKGYDNVFDVGVGLEFEKYSDTTISESTKELLNEVGDASFLLYVGRIDKNKNTQFLLDVFEIVLKKHPSTKLVLVGKQQKTLLDRVFHRTKSTYLKSLLKKHSKLLKDQLIYIDGIDNNQLQFLYSKSSAFLLPSVKEIFGMVLLEAMYFGAPVVSSFNGGAVSLIKSDEYGQIIKDFNTNAWADAVFKYLENRDYTLAVKENAKQNVQNNYNWNAIVGKILGTAEYDF